MVLMIHIELGSNLQHAKGKERKEKKRKELRLLKSFIPPQECCAIVLSKPQCKVYLTNKYL